ncbi:Uncharacterised protein [Mycobacteroides abscessus subsp. abscessus]|nr:Uncharacterised protein [Mycobacteroides abscessus subsp. abscessus]
MAVAEQGGSAQADDAQDLVQDIGGSGGGLVGQAVICHLGDGVQAGLGVRQRGDTGVFGHRAQPVEPGHGEPLPGARVYGTGGVGRIVQHLVVLRHLVDGHQQVGVDGHADRACQLALGVNGGLGRELQRAQQRVQPAPG